METENGLISSLKMAPTDSMLPQDAGKTTQAAPSTILATLAKNKVRIGEHLINMGLISNDQLEIALLEQRHNKKMLGVIMVEMGFITESALAEALAESTGRERFDAKKTILDPQVLSLLPKEVAIRQKVVPISMEDNVIQLAMADVYNVLAIDYVRRYFPKQATVYPLYCTESEIQALIAKYYEYELSIDGILREIETGIRENNNYNMLDGSQEGYVSPTVRLVNALLVDAIKQGASDIHFEPENAFLRLRYRIDGQMMQIRSFHRDYWPAIAVRIKIVSGMNIAESRLPQDGRITFTFMGREVDFRVASQPTVHGENIVMRILDKAQALLPVEQLGFSEHNSNILRRLLKRPEGIIVVTGPTGSGKTTSLYSILSYINSMSVNIMTLEDPVEYRLPLIRQSNVREGSIDFLTGIKSMMRQDPDIIFVGEVRDEETALMAVRASMTGHQVFTTLHTNDALGVIPRLNDIGVPSHLLAGALIGCLAQRLVRKLCNECKEPHEATPEECHIMGLPFENPPSIYKEVGCPACRHQGFKGRMAIVEILRVDKEIDELIAERATRRQLLRYALDNGFIPMAEDGIQKVLEGLTSLNELIRHVDMTDRL